MIGKLPLVAILTLTALILGFAGLASAEPVNQPGYTPEALFNLYQTKQKAILARYLELENKADGLTPDFRKALGDRKSKIEPQFQKKGKTLSDPFLLQAIITERKRLENEAPTLSEWSSSGYMLQQNLKKIAANMLRLETSEIVLTYGEYFDQFNRGERPVPAIKRNPKENAKQRAENDLALMKLSAATVLAIDYTKERKAQMAFSNPWIIAQNPKEAKATLDLLESGLGKMSEDTLFPVRDVASKADQGERLNRTRLTMDLMDKLVGAFIISNKPFFDEYQYHLIKMKQTLDHVK